MTRARSRGRPVSPVAIAVGFVLLISTIALSGVIAFQVARPSCISNQDRLLPPCFDQAQAAFDRALQLTGSYVASPNEEYLVEAFDLVHRGLARRPQNAQAWLLLAQIEMFRGNAQSALTALNRSLELGPYEKYLARLQLRLGVDLLSAADPELGEVLCEKVVWLRKVDREKFENHFKRSSSSQRLFITSCLDQV